jgi:RNA polymerase sigma factor (sigma-70 family)
MFEQETTMDNDNQCSANIYTVAREIAALYPGIISVQGLAEQLACQWKEHGGGEEQAVSLLRRMALGVCSRATCEAWRSGEAERRERAFEVMRSYLHRMLLRARYTSIFQHDPHTLDDILSQTLETLFVMLRDNAEAGPTNPTAFLDWIHTILKRNIYACLKRRQQDSFLSLEEQFEELAEQWVDQQHDPIAQVLHEELQQALKAAILSLRNPRYKQVLWYSFLAGMDESELASRLHVPAAKIALWKHRALKMLRGNKEIVQALRSLAG